MFKIYRFFFSFLLFCSPLCFSQPGANTVVLSKNEPLFSTRNGRALGNIALSIEVKSLDTNPKQFYLVIGERNSDILESGKTERSLWIFNKKFTLNELKKETKNQNFNLEARDFREFEPFFDSSTKFDMKSWEELRRQTRYTFYADGDPGREVSLRLRFYLASKDRKTTNIEDDARVSLSFTIPQPTPTTTASTTQRQTTPTTTQSPQQNAYSAPPPQTSRPQSYEPGGVVLAETVGAQQAAAKSEKEAAAAQQQLLAQQEIAQRQRTDDVNVQITVKNKEIAAILFEIELMSDSKKRKVTKNEVDSLELNIVKLKKEVDLLDRGYTDILLKDPTIQDKFTKFSTDQVRATKMLEDIREQKLGSKNMLGTIGIIAGIVMMVALLLLQIVRPMLTKKQQQKTAQMQQKMQMGGSQAKNVGSAVGKIDSSMKGIKI